MIASTLLALLRARHADDVFVDECKSGPTQLTEHERIDAWVMAKSWAHPMVTGYEIKVSRGDFLRDQKWQRYLPMCNALYFVCPAKLIAPNELPDDVGLMWASMTGSRLYTKKRAKPRDVTIPEDVWRYILMSRVRITREQFTSANKR
ncbi:MAG: MmcB family DNA repair protein, partial [Gammaproteobacteria bacterium]